MENKFRAEIQKELERLNVKPMEEAVKKLSELPTYEGEFSSNDVLVGVNMVLVKMGKEAVHPSIMAYVDKEAGAKLGGKEV